jgi:hypothetical protein
MLFECLGNILKTKSIELYDEHIKSENFKDFSKFMCLRYLTMSTNSNVREIVLNNYISLERMPSNELLYKWLIKNIPKQNNSFIQYIR